MLFALFSIAQRDQCLSSRVRGLIEFSNIAVRVRTMYIVQLLKGNAFGRRAGPSRVANSVESDGSKKLTVRSVCVCSRTVSRNRSETNASVHQPNACPSSVIRPPLCPTRTTVANVLLVRLGTKAANFGAKFCAALC